MIYHPKHKIAYYLKHIKFKRHIILAIGFLIADPLLVNLLCRAVDAAIPSELDYLAESNVASSLFKVMIPIGLLPMLRSNSIELKLDVTCHMMPKLINVVLLNCLSSFHPQILPSLT